MWFSGKCFGTSSCLSFGCDWVQAVLLVEAAINEKGCCKRWWLRVVACPVFPFCFPLCWRCLCVFLLLLQELGCCDEGVLAWSWHEVCGAGMGWWQALELIFLGGLQRRRRRRWHPARLFQSLLQEQLPVLKLGKMRCISSVAACLVVGFQAMVPWKSAIIPWKSIHLASIHRLLFSQVWIVGIMRQFHHNAGFPRSVFC